MLWTFLQEDINMRWVSSKIRAHMRFLNLTKYIKDRSSFVKILVTIGILFTKPFQLRRLKFSSKITNYLKKGGASY